jgi:hypothetical protein
VMNLVTSAIEIIVTAGLDSAISEARRDSRIKSGNDDRKRGI